MFVGRNDELKELKRLYDTNTYQCVVMYGRRRVGKTALITEFIKDKEAVFFTGQETSAGENLENLSGSIFSLSQEFPGIVPLFPNYKQALEVVFSMSQKRRIVFVIDEYPYLAESYSGISSLLQTLIDANKANSKIFIILCGSSLSFMENQVLGSKSPLFGRRTSQMKVLPFDFEQTADYFAQSDYNAEDKAILYGITGGIPHYLSFINSGQTVAENIKQNFLKLTGYLFEEPGNLIKQECREPAKYNAILTAIASGACRLSEISNRVKLETGLCSSYISKLISIGIVEKKYPFRNETGKRTIYSLCDNMFRFWYSYIPGLMSLIQRGEMQLAYEQISPQLPAFMGAVFEEICMQYLWKQNAARKTPFTFLDAGCWWGNNPIKKEEREIDIVADNKESAIFAECKWTNAEVDGHILDRLIENAAIFDYNYKYYYIFAKTGFTDVLVKKAGRMENVFLVKINDML